MYSSFLFQKYHTGVLLINFFQNYLEQKPSISENFQTRLALSGLFWDLSFKDILLGTKSGVLAG